MVFITGSCGMRHGAAFHAGTLSMIALKKILPVALALALLATAPVTAIALSSSGAAAAVASATGGQVLAVQPAGGGFRVKVRIGSEVKWCSVDGSGRVSC
ncbi:MAG: hypothetical protein V2I51_18270 [Anderseniella sp.]|jgi:hypothetical protein|nr:hypothetical protein [Anderseniella sp.]